MQNDFAEAYWTTGPFEGQIKREAIDQCEPDKVLVQTLFSGISRGTESLVAACLIPQSQYQVMRCPFQAGDFPFPVKYGYANVGRVEQGPGHLLDRTVFCLYPHQTRFRVPIDAVNVVPDTIPPGRAVLAANMETALNGVWDSGVAVGDRVYVLGAGVVGILTAWIADNIPGTEVTLLDIDEGRRTIAEKLNIAFASLDQARQEADIVFDCSGAPSGLAQALELAGFEAVITVMSWFGSNNVTLPLGEAFHSKRLQLRSSQVGSIGGGQRARWSFKRRMAKAIELLQEDKLDALINHESSFQELPNVLPGLARGQTNALCHRIRYN